MTDKLDEATIRACIAALPAFVTFGTGALVNSESRAALEALLPKSDPAEALLKEWRDSLGRGAFMDFMSADARKFAQWLLITSLAEQIRNSIGNEDELNALADRLDAQSNTLADAVRANTPADPEGETEE